MQRNEMLFCKGRMGDKKNHLLSFGQMQSTPCTRGTNVFVKPNEQCRACSNIVMARKHTFRGTKNNIFLFGRARDQPLPLVRPKQSLAFMPFLAWPPANAMLRTAKWEQSTTWGTPNTNTLVKPNAQCRTYLGIDMTRYRYSRRTRIEKERLLPSTYTLYVDIPVEVQQDIDFTIEERDLQND